MKEPKGLLNEVLKFFRDSLVQIVAAVVAVSILTLFNPLHFGLIVTITILAVVLLVGTLFVLFYLLWQRRRPLIRSKGRRRILMKYLQQECATILDAFTPGFTDLRVRDIVGNDGIFIPPPWDVLHGAAYSMELVEYLVKALSDSQRVLLLGEAGQGKTTILKHVFTTMVDHFLENPKPKKVAPLPIYIPLRDFTYPPGNTIESLWAFLQNKFPLPFEDFASLMDSNQIVFLFDGFDEIKGELSQNVVNERASSSIFSHPSILSCRKSFYELYLTVSSIQERYPLKVELKPLALTEAVMQFIVAFCNKKQPLTQHKIIMTPEKIFETIRGSQELQDLVQRPLLLIMILEIFTGPTEISENVWSIGKLYQKYTTKWLRNEIVKPDSILSLEEKMVLVKEIAWETYLKRSPSTSPYGLHETVEFTREDLYTMLKPLVAHYQQYHFRQIVDDICLRTFLITNDGEKYYFIHESFQEYYVAKYVFDRIRQSGNGVSHIAQVLQELIPAEVDIFLKDMLSTKDNLPREREQMTDNLIKVYRQNGGNDDNSAVIRQYAGYYLTVLATPKAIQFLEQSYKQEPNKWVQRGLMVGLALYAGRTEILEEYLDIIRIDDEAASINVGYHLVHYGDQALEQGYYDQKGERCVGTVLAILRHLRSDYYKDAWALDLVTLRMLLEQRGIATIVVLYSDKQYLAFLKDFLNRDHSMQGRIFQQEKKRLQELLRVVPPL